MISIGSIMKRCILFCGACLLLAGLSCLLASAAEPLPLASAVDNPGMQALSTDSTGLFGLTVGTTWFYGAGSTYEGQDLLYGVRKQIIDTLASGVRVVRVKWYYADGTRVILAHPEYWYDDGHGSLYKLDDSSATLVYPFYDASLTHDTSFAAGPYYTIYTWGYSYHLFAADLFGVTLPAQSVSRSIYSKASSYSDYWVSAPGYGFIKSFTSTQRVGAGQDSLILVGMCKDGVVLGDTSFSAWYTAVARAPSWRTTTLSVTPVDIWSDDTSTAAIVMRVRDAMGNPVTKGGAQVWIVEEPSQIGYLDNYLDHGDGTYSWVLHSNPYYVGYVVLKGFLNNRELAQKAAMRFINAQTLSMDTVVISADPNAVIADRKHSSTIRVQLLDYGGEPFHQSGGQMVLHTTLGSLGEVTDNDDGTYTAVLTSDTSKGLAILSASLAGREPRGTATVLFRSLDWADTSAVAFLLEQNFPNPFNSHTVIGYGLVHNSYVSLTVFNTLGQRVAELVHRQVEAGYHEFRFDSSGLASGVYFYRLTAGEFAETKRMILVR